MSKRAKEENGVYFEKRKKIVKPPKISIINLSREQPEERRTHLNNFVLEPARDRLDPHVFLSLLLHLCYVSLVLLREPGKCVDGAFPQTLHAVSQVVKPHTKKENEWRATAVDGSSSLYVFAKRPFINKNIPAGEKR